ncbi:phosphatase PAP2 family protein [uncultured Thiothrix sp.]|uniref:phosphatase PAP2 family protein n=1 Tax=uncultured Thiothrix sp. TaxID=223185 RepID=UPI002632B278|nr:phosphatase PAP2 family protein [uncultured Thiothrix sp.]
MNPRLNHRFLIAALVAALLGVFGFITRVSIAGYTTFDSSLSELIRSWRSPVLDPPMLIATLLGNWLVVTVAFTTLCLMLIYQKRWALFTAILTTIAGAGAFVSGIKSLVEAGRPELNLYERGVSVYSFPSGHTTFSSLLGLWLIWFAVRGIQKPWVRLLSVLILALMILMVAVSRIYLGAHWPTDIATGFLFSISLALIFSLVFEHQYTDHSADLRVLQASVLAYVIAGLIYVSYKWASAIVMYTPST